MTAPAVDVVAGGRVAPLDIEAVGSDPAALEALASLVAPLRAARYSGAPPDPSASRPIAALVELARGRPASGADVGAAIGRRSVHALLRAGVLSHDELDGTQLGSGFLRLRGRIFPLRSTMTFLEEHLPVDGVDVVYLGADSVLLLREVWARCGFGDRAADLGTGNGLLAAALATRFDHVVAADISARCTATAALIPPMNPHLAGRLSVVRADIATCLRPGSFDVVVANAPWVPEAVPTELDADAPLGAGGAATRRFAAGGPTGFELPRRFLDQAAGLLVPGGRAFVACTDITFADGARPLHEHLPVLEGRGVDVEVTVTSLGSMHDLVAWARARVDGAVDVAHVVVSLRRRA